MTAAETSALRAFELDPGERRRVVVVAPRSPAPPARSVSLADVVAVHADVADAARRPDRPRPPAATSAGTPPRRSPTSRDRAVDARIERHPSSDNIADMDGVTHPPHPVNEPNLTYAPGAPSGRRCSSSSSASSAGR